MRAMSEMIRVALVGNYSADVPAHLAIPRALAMAGTEQGCMAHEVWIPTETLPDHETVNDCLSEYDGVWCVPASPYRSMEGALMAIQWARENRRPFLGTCGGYQHAVLEFARNVLGFAQAGNIEVDPHTPMPIIAPLVCELVDARGEITFTPNSTVAKIYGTERATELYRCSYGFNPAYIPLFDDSALTISGWDVEGEPRVIELNDHPFFIGTAYQPERSALYDQQHPLISAYVRAMVTEGITTN